MLLNFLPASGIVMTGGVWSLRRLFLLKGVGYYGNLPSRSPVSLLRLTRARYSRPGNEHVWIHASSWRALAASEEASASWSKGVAVS